MIKQIQLLIIFLTIFTAFSCSTKEIEPMSQSNYSNSMLTLIEAGKDTIIAIAKNTLGNIDYAKYQEPMIFGNPKLNLLEVRFYNPIYPVDFYPLNQAEKTTFIKSITVRIDDKKQTEILYETQYQYTENEQQFDELKKVNFREEDIAKVSFVQKVIEDDFIKHNGFLFNVYGSRSVFKKFDKFKITEKDAFYKILVLDSYTSSNYKITKKDAKIYDESHHHMIFVTDPNGKMMLPQKTINHWKELFQTSYYPKSISYFYIATQLSLYKDNKKIIRFHSAKVLNIYLKNGSKKTGLYSINKEEITLTLADDVYFRMITKEDKFTFEQEKARKLFYENLKNPNNFFEITLNNKKEITRITQSRGIFDYDFRNEK